MTRAELLDLYSNSIEMLDEAVTLFPREMWHWRPAVGKWTIHEIIIHIADSEANSYVRLRRLLAETGSEVVAYDENLWAEKLHYEQQSVDEAMVLFRILRKSSASLLSLLKEESYIYNKIHHSDNGWMTFDEWLDNYAFHVPIHINQMKRNYKEWEQLHTKH
jgi:hypothetical protein